MKLLANPADRLLLGAHIIGPQAATLIQPGVLAEARESGAVSASLDVPATALLILSAGGRP